MRRVDLGHLLHAVDAGREETRILHGIEDGLLRRAHGEFAGDLHALPFNSIVSSEAMGE